MKTFFTVCFLSVTVAFSNGLYQPYTVYHPGWLAGLVRSSTHLAASPFLSPEPQEELMGMIRLQSARLTEISLAAKPQEEIQCFQKAICVVGATTEKKEDRIKKMSGITLAKGINQFTKILELMVSDIEQSSQHHAKDFPQIYQVLGSHTVGYTTRDVALCHRLFNCPESVNDFSIPFEQRQSRTTCDAISAVCPGVTIGCAVCGAFSPGTCGDQCVVAGLYCGTSLLACSKQKEDQGRRLH